MILVISELLSQEQDFRCYCCPATSDDVHKLQSIPQQFPDDEHGVDVASPGDLKSKHESFSFAQNGTGFFTNGRKILEFEPALIHFTNCRGFCGAQRRLKSLTSNGKNVYRQSSRNLSNSPALGGGFSQ